MADGALWLLLARKYAERGGKAFVAYPRITTLSPTVAQSDIEPVELTIPWRNPTQRQATLGFLRDNDVRALYLTDQPWFKPQYFHYRRHGVETICVHDHTPGDRPAVTGIKGLIKTARNRLPAVCADYVFAVSPLMRERSIRNGRVPANRCIVVQNGIEPVPPSRSREAKRKELGIPTESTVVITTGRAHPYKRFDLVIDTAAAMKTLAPELDIRFLLVGDGPAFKDLKMEVQQRQLESHVKLLGFRKDTRELLGTADIAMHAALGEGFSLSIIEYMSAGLAVLVPDIPSVKQAIDHEKTGIVYAKDSPEGAARWLLRLTEDSALLEGLGRSAKEKVSETYSLDRCSADFLAACDRAFKL